VQTLSLSLRSKGEEGEPLPVVFHQLDRLGVKFRRGWLHLIGAAPGGGKSALATFMALRLQIPTLYFSPDNDKLTFGTAAVANALDISTNEAEERLEYGDREAFDLLDEFTGHLWVSFQSGPSPQDIHLEMEAFATVYGAYPELVIVDNLMDVDGSAGGFDSERTTQDGILDFLKRLGRETGAAVVVLCHVVGQYTNGNVPIPRDGLINKPDKRPQVVLTLYRPGDGWLGVCVVKNRRNRQAPDGSLQAFIPWFPETAWFGTGG
jgi:hypothetical protein